MLPDIILVSLAYILHPQDLLYLSLTCKRLHSVYSSPAIWKSKTIVDFGDLFHIYNLVTTSTQLTLDPYLKETFQQEPIDWCRYYISKNTSLIDNKIHETLIYKADKEYTAAYNRLQTFEREKDVAVMNEAAAKMIRILDVFPAHAGCYYILGYILYVFNQLEEALILLRMGQKVDNTFGTIKTLIRNIQHILEAKQAKMNRLPLLVNDHTLTAPLANALLDMFALADQDRDDALNDQELDNFLHFTRGSRLPAPFLQQMILRFGADNHGRLTKNGFLAFYLKQTLDDPSKTRNDVGLYGFDPHSLEPVDRLV